MFFPFVYFSFVKSESKNEKLSENADTEVFCTEDSEVSYTDNSML